MDWDFTKIDSVYKLVMDGIPISKESVTRYKNYFILILTEKIELSERIYVELKISGQISILVNDMGARWMYNKKIKGNIHIIFNPL